MPSSAHTTQPAAWPEGVIARYLTIAGALVDIWYDNGTLRTRCGGEGCSWTECTPTRVFYTDSDEVRDQKIADALPGLQPDAQAHAEKCRALPRPTA
jgi:hypothetical protein